MSEIEIMLLFRRHGQTSWRVERPPSEGGWYFGDRRVRGDDLRLMQKRGLVVCFTDHNTKHRWMEWRLSEASNGPLLEKDQTHERSTKLHAA